MKTSIVNINIESKNPQELFEEIEHEELTGLPSAEIRRRMEIVHNAMDYNLNKCSQLLDRIADGFQMLA
jgi:hypothetical protein